MFRAGCTSILNVTLSTEQQRKNNLDLINIPIIQPAYQ